MAALILHYLGQQEDARSLLAPHLDRRSAQLRQSQISRFLLDQDVAVQALLSRILWIRGFPDQATRTAQWGIEKAESIGHRCHCAMHWPRECVRSRFTMATWGQQRLVWRSCLTLLPDWDWRGGSPAAIASKACCRSCRTVWTSACRCCNRRSPSCAGRERLRLIPPFSERSHKAPDGQAGSARASRSLNRR